MRHRIPKISFEGIRNAVIILGLTLVVVVAMSLYYFNQSTTETKIVFQSDLKDLKHHFFLLAIKLLFVAGCVGVGSAFILRKLKLKRNDITLQKSREVERVLSRLSNFKSAMDIHSMMSRADGDGHIVDANERFLDTTGFSKEEILGQKYSIFQSGYHSPEFYKDLWRTIKSGQFWHGEIKNKKKNGDIFWVETTILPVSLDGLDDQQFVCIQTDITDKKIREEILLNAKEQADLENHRKTKFIAHLSHEIRTPLSSIVGYTDLIESEPDLGSDVKKYIRTIKKNADFLLNIIGEILDFSKVSAGQLEVHQKKSSLVSVIRKAIDLFVDADPQIDLKVALIPPLPEFIHTDLIRFNQILVNLIGNAFKFTVKGSITVKFRVSDQRLNELKNKLVVEVEDTGIGIHPEDQFKIFKPFSQSTMAYRRDVLGTGLGLALSKEIALLLGGDLILKRSKVGVGSTFNVYIDYQGKEEVRWLDEATVKFMNQRLFARNESGLCRRFRMRNLYDGIKILLIEDSDDIRELLRIQLVGVGAEVYEACDARQAMKILEEIDLDAVLMDIQLPILSGHQTVGLIHEVRPDLPVIALTANSTLAVRKACFDRGFYDFFSKPLQFEKLLRALRKFRKKRRVLLNRDHQVYPLYSAFESDPSVKVNLLRFLTRSLDQCEEMRKDLNLNDWAMIEQLMHKMKGAFSTYGYPEISQYADEIESLVQSEEKVRARKQLIEQNLSQIDLLIKRALLALL